MKIYSNINLVKSEGFFFKISSEVLLTMKNSTLNFRRVVLKIEGAIAIRSEFLFSQVRLEFKVRLQ
jgi:hypothetical protein